MKTLSLAILLVIQPFSELLRFRFSNNVSLRISDIYIALFVLFHVLKNRDRILGWLKKHPELPVFSAILITSNLSFFFLELTPTAAGFLYLIRTLVYLMLIPILDNTASLPNLKRLFGWSLVFIILSGLGQYFLYPDLRNLYYLGYDPHFYRLFGLFLDPNIIGLLFVWVFFYFLSQKQKPIIKIPILISSLAALLLTYSRISWICLVMGTLFLAYTRKKWAYLGVVVFLAIGLVFLPRYFGESTNILRLNSLIGKQASMKLANDIFWQSPLIGIGFNNLNQLKPHNPNLPDNSRFGLDNSFLTIAATTGILGLASYGFLLINLFFRSKTEIGRIATLTFAVHSLSVNSFFVPPLFVYYLLFSRLFIQRK